MRHYQNVLLGFACVWLLAMGLAAWSVMNAFDEREYLEKSRVASLSAGMRAESSQREAQEMELRMPKVRAFLAEWEAHMRRGADERELGIAIRMGLESLAQQRLSLVTDQATTPEAGKVLLGGKVLRVQRVSLRASGESLPALVTWLGEAESSFPYARVEGWELVSAGGNNCSLKAMLSHPLSGDSGEGKGGRVK